MTIGIAAICNQGKNMIVATDGMLSAEVSADISAFKMQFLDDWLFAFSGTLSNADLIMEELRMELEKTGKSPSRSTIQGLLRRAYRKRQSQWVFDRNLSIYDFTSMPEFRRDGIKVFGEKLFGEHDALIRQDLMNFNEYVLVTGWGKSEQSAMIYGMGPDGPSSSSLTGFATVGAGWNVAQNMLLLLGCARHVSFEHALYAVAAAKFSAESCEGIGKSTAIAVTHKRTAKDDAGKPPVKFLPSDDMTILRTLWEEHTKPKIPEEAVPHLCAIAQKIVGEVTPGAMIRAMHQRQKADDS